MNSDQIPSSENIQEKRSYISSLHPYRMVCLSSKDGVTNINIFSRRTSRRAEGSNRDDVPSQISIRNNTTCTEDLCCTTNAKHIALRNSNTICIWDGYTCDLVHTRTFDTEIVCMRSVPTQSMFVIGFKDKTIKFINSINNEIIKTYTFEYKIHNMDVSSDGKKIIIASDEWVPSSGYPSLLFDTESETTIWTENFYSQNIPYFQQCSYGTAFAIVRNSTITFRMLGPEGNITLHTSINRDFIEKNIRRRQTKVYTYEPKTRYYGSYRTVQDTGNITCFGFNPHQGFQERMIFTTGDNSYFGYDMNDRYEGGMAVYGKIPIKHICYCQDGYTIVTTHPAGLIQFSRAGNICGSMKCEGEIMSMVCPILDFSTLIISSNI